MKTDALCYEVFQTMPQSYFEMIGSPPTTAAGYMFASEELKQAGMRLDGVFLPARPESPVHFVEVFFYKTPHAYANLFAKVFLWLETRNPAQDWHACIVFASRRVEPIAKHPYRALLASDQVSCIYLDELPRVGKDQLGLGILKMIASPAEQALHEAREWLKRVGQWKKPVSQRRKAVELIELVVLGHFPAWTRKELEHMLQVRDFRETKLYQEALEEGLEQGLEKGQQLGLEKGREQGVEKGRELGRREIAMRLLEKKHSVAEVAELTGLSVQQVRSLKRGKR